jgi:Cdc6-like AAA superfamily ATPase
MTRHAFTPGAPIDKLDLFAGRLDQIMEVLGALDQRGQHVVLYGERGVGKKSLANVLGEMNVSRGGQVSKLPAASVNCSSSDDFTSIWRHLLQELGIAPGDEALPELSPEDVRHALERVHVPTLVVIDEVDSLEDRSVNTLLADTVKTLSDHSVQVTLVLVGVADSVERLIGEHPSTERALTQIHAGVCVFTA